MQTTCTNFNLFKKMSFRYTLHTNSIKHSCPNCKQKRFVRYIDIETNEYVGENVGRCDREVNCAYHLTPSMFFKNNKLPYKPISNKKIIKHNKNNEIDYHTLNDLTSSLTSYHENNFSKYINSVFTEKQTNKMINEYKIGTALNWYNSTIFWQIDIHQNIRGGKLINYQKNGKRTKLINWVHALKIKHQELEYFNLKQCLFGEHLVLNNEKPIAIVESEKTACIMSIVFPKYLWLATGSLRGLTKEKLIPIRNSRIVLYPDLGMNDKNSSPYEIWYNNHLELKQLGFDIHISDLLEKNSSKEQRIKGLDIADYFLVNQKRKPTKIVTKSESEILKLYMKNKNLKTLIEVFDLTDLNNKKINLD